MKTSLVIINQLGEFKFVNMISKKCGILRCIKELDMDYSKYAFQAS